MTAPPSPPPSLSPLPSPAPLAAPLLRRPVDLLASLCDPEWLLFLAVLLLPAALSWGLGEPARAAFFLGAAVYIAVLKWLGWALFSRLSWVRPAFLLFPAELFVGLAVACAWFYLRNLLARVWPAGYSLRELSPLFYLLLGLHVAAFALQARTWLSATSWRVRLRELLGRAAMYLPFVVALTAALWSISTARGVQGTDPMLYSFMARVYLNDGIAFRVPPMEVSLAYPSGFGAMNAVTAAVAPLDVVQALHLQHVLLCIAALFLMTGTVAALTGRSLALLHSLPLPFLFVFPLYALYPDILYPGTPKQAGPPLFVAICLLPLLAPTVSRGAFGLALAACSVLPPLAVALNPACGLFTAVAALVGTAILAARGQAVLGSWPRVVALQAALTLLAAGLVAGCDVYYGHYLQAAVRPSSSAQSIQAGGDSAPPPDRQPVVFSVADAARLAATVNPVGLSPHISTTDLRDHYAHLRGGHDGGAQRLVVLAALLAALLALVSLARQRGRQALPAGWGLPGFVLVGLGLWFALKYGATFFAGGFSLKHPVAYLLNGYTRYLLLRCELLIVFGLLAAAGAHLFLTAERRNLLRGWRAAIAGGLLVVVCWAVPAAGLRAATGLSGTLTIPSQATFAVGADDLRVVAWLNDNVPPGSGQVGLAAFTFLVGPNDEQKHMYPIGPGHALPIYGRHYNFRFFLSNLEGDVGFEAYQRHVRDHFDAAWCRRNGIRYFFATPEGLQQNPGLHEAVRRGELRPVYQSGASAVYELTTEQ